MKNELNAELLQALVDEFVSKNIKILDKVSSSEEDIYYEGIEYEAKQGLIENFYEELKYIHNIYDYNLEEIKNKIRNARVDFTKKKEKVLEKLKETDYVYNFVFNNYNDISERKLEGLINFLREKGFYPLDKDDLMKYIKSIEIIEEEIPYKPDELKTQLDEEFREYVLKFVNLLEKQRIKFGISEDKFKTIILKILKVKNYETKDPKYDYKTKKYYLLKEIAETPKEIEPYYLVKYYNIQTGKIYYSVYYGNGTIIYNKIPSREKAILMTKNIEEYTEHKHIKKHEKTEDKQKQSKEELTKKDKLKKKQAKSKEKSNDEKPTENEQDTNLAYVDDEILSDQEYIREHIQNIHKRQEEKLHAKGSKLFPIFRIIALILAVTIIGIPFSFMILLVLRINDALRGNQTKAKSRAFIIISKIFGWILFIPLIAGVALILVTIFIALAQNKTALIITNPLFISGIISAISGFVFAMPMGILLWMLSLVTERAEQKYKIEHSKGYKTDDAIAEKEQGLTNIDEQTEKQNPELLSYDANNISTENQNTKLDEDDVGDTHSKTDTDADKNTESETDEHNPDKDNEYVFDIEEDEQSEIFGKEEETRRADDYEADDYEADDEETYY